MKNNIKTIELLIQNKKFDEAIKLLDNLSELESKNNQYNFLKGFSYLNLNDYKNAIKYFNLAIENEDKNLTFYFYRGLTYSKINEFQRTIEDYEKIIFLKPNSPEIYNNIAQLY